jgi:hypothetical protein
MRSEERGECHALIIKDVRGTVLEQGRRRAAYTIEEVFYEKHDKKRGKSRNRIVNAAGAGIDRDRLSNGR